MSFTATYRNKLTASNVVGGDYYGSSMVMSADGETLAVAASYSSGSSNQANGAIRILSKSGSTWTQTASFLVPSSGDDDYFDYSLAMSADGTTLVVGVQSADSSYTDDGKAYVYKFASGSWSIFQTINSPTGANDDNFGASVSISGNGLTIVAGATKANKSGFDADSGGAYVYYYNGSAYALQASLYGADTTSNDFFGNSVSLSHDGSYLAVGAIGEYTSTNPHGTVYVYVRSANSWSQQQKITAATASSGDLFGHSLAMSADGYTLAIGSSSADDTATSNKSSVSIFKRTGSVWALEGSLLKSGSGTSEYFGHSLSMSFDGDTLLAGVWEGDTGNSTESGAAYVFRRASGTWSQAQRLVASDSNLASYFGYSVALASRLGSMAVGAPYNSDSASYSSNSGSIYDYSISLTDADTYYPLVLPNKTIVTAQRTITSISLSWSKAIDNVDSPSSLLYEVRYSSSNNLTSVADFEANGTVAMAYTSDVDSATINNLYPGRNYYVNVCVKDSAGNKTLYSSHSTYTFADTTAPVPGSSGTLVATNVALSSLTLSWAKATDNYSTAENISYAVYRSTSNNIATLTDALANGTKILDYTSDISSYNVSGLLANVTYYFNVIAQDQFGRAAAYSSISQKTLADTSSPTPGVLSVSSFGMTSIGLSWTAATDNYSSSMNLEYAVYMSSSDNIGSVADAEANGTLVREYTAASLYKLVSNLSPSTYYYFNVIVKDQSGNKAAYSSIYYSTSSDTTAPTAGNSGIVSAIAISENQIDLSWTAATDNYSAAGDLTYAVYRSTSNNISSVMDAEANGTKVMDYSANTVSYSATGLTYNTSYYFNVIVKDGFDNKTAYVYINESTLGDSSAPVPGSSGLISVSSVSERTVNLSWSAASDNLTSASNLEYAIYVSSSNNITTLTDAEANGTKVVDYIANITTYGVGSLNADTTYYFNVVVRDSAGNKAAYAGKSAKTAADATNPYLGAPSTISVTNLADISLTLNWTKGTDNYDNPTSLVYKVYRASSNTMTSVNQTEYNGTLIGTGINIGSFDVTGLSPSTSYYFNVIVVDAAGNKSAYTSVNTTTLTDAQAPVPGNSGSISMSGATVSSISASWTAATDNITSAANLQYALYRSTSSNISSIADIEVNGTVVMDYSANTLNYTASGLNAATTYYFNVIVKDATGNKSAYSVSSQMTQADMTPPVPGSSGAISTSYITKSSMVLSWTKAVDNYTAQSAIRYEVRRSTSNNIGTVATFKNGTIVKAFTNDISTVVAEALMPNTTYYFNVMAMDASGNRAVYSMTSAATEADISGPAPGNYGIINFAGTTMQETAISWAKASDEATYFEDLEYALYMSTSSNIATVANAEANGTMIMDYELDVASFPMTDLVPGTTYYFNVLVRDELGNKSAYEMGAVTTVADTLAPVPGNSGSVLSDSAMTSSVRISWSKAEDDITEQSDIAYVLYKSMSNNISTVAQMESNGTVVMGYTADVTEFNVTGLNTSSVYYFNVAAKDAAGNKAAYVPAKVATVVDTSIPSPGNSGILGASLATPSSITLSWTKGTDNVTEAGFLMYGVYRSTSNNLATVAQIEANGTLFRSFSRDIAVQTVTGLDSDTTYYFNVIVKDSAGNKACYSPVSGATLEDIEAPVPGGSGVITASAVTLNSMILSWNRATDNASSPPNLQYQVRMSTSNNLATVANAEANGTIVGAYSSLNYVSVTGLNSGDTYYFNVIVKDAKGNKSVYAVKEQKTKNDVIEVPSAPIAINEAIIVESSIDKIKTLPQIASNPSLSKPRNWAKVHIIYKSTTSAKRVVVSITDFSQMVGTFKAKNAEVFAVHKVIVEDANNNFVTVPASFIMNADNWNIEVD